VCEAIVSQVGVDRQQQNREFYDTFVAEGSLTVVKTMTEGTRLVVQKVQSILDSGRLGKVGLDTSSIVGIVDALAQIRVTEDNDLLIGVRQGPALMGAADGLAWKAEDGTLLHDGSELMAWCVGNAVMHQAKTSHYITKDAGGSAKVDPLVAAVMAAELMADNPKARGSIYNRPGRRNNPLRIW